MWEGTATHAHPPSLPRNAPPTIETRQGEREHRAPRAARGPLLPPDFASPLPVQKEARKVPVGGTRINPAAGLDKLAGFSAWHGEHETNGSESEKQGGGRGRDERSPGVSSFPEKGEEAFGEGGTAGSE